MDSELKSIISGIFSEGRGILAMDESIPTCNKRLAASGIEQNEEMRRRYRQLLVTTPGLEKNIGGAILSDETIRQKTDSGRPMAAVLTEKGIIPGIKVDRSTVAMPNFTNEKITEGLDGLRERLAEYKSFGARFAKWRAVIKIGENIPSRACIRANIHSLTCYAALCQEAAVVPIVEPEVLMDGSHSLQQCFDITKQVLKMLFLYMDDFRVNESEIILKPNMILPGKDNPASHSIAEIAGTTFKCLQASVPASVPAIAFLSGGQKPEDASAHLDTIHKKYQHQLPWILSFSFARAIQQPVLETWKGRDSTVESAQKALLHRTALNRKAGLGIYSPALESHNIHEKNKENENRNY